MGTITEKKIRQACAASIRKGDAENIGYCLLLLHPGDSMWVPQRGQRGARDLLRTNEGERDVYYRIGSVVGMGIGAWIGPVAEAAPDPDGRLDIVCAHGTNRHRRARKLEETS